MMNIQIFMVRRLHINYFDTVESFLMHEEISFEDGAEIFSSILNRKICLNCGIPDVQLQICT